MKFCSNLRVCPLTAVAGVVGAVGLLVLLWRLVSMGKDDDISWLERRRKPQPDPWDGLQKLLMDIARPVVMGMVTAWISKAIMQKASLGGQAGGQQYNPVGAGGYNSLKDQFSQAAIKALMNRMRGY